MARAAPANPLLCAQRIGSHIPLGKLVGIARARRRAARACIRRRSVAPADGGGGQGPEAVRSRAHRDQDQVGVRLWGKRRAAGMVSWLTLRIRPQPGRLVAEGGDPQGQPGNPPGSQSHSKSPPRVGVAKRRVGNRKTAETLCNLPIPLPGAPPACSRVRHGEREKDYS